ncbi:MAG TPA: chemotaxis protein CheA [Polyangiaceae bacterium]|nr:chemotaxis protein CheA [Polyangiaceae bacterium]
MTLQLTDLQRQLLGTFFEESFEGLEQLETGLLALERSSKADPETINDVFRVAHSIKGGAGSFGLAAISRLAHEMETLLDGFRAGALSPTPDALSLLLEGVDGLRGMLEATRDERGYSEESLGRLCERLKAASARSAPHPAAPAEPQSPPAARSERTFAFRFEPHSHLLESGNEPVRLLRELARLGALKLEVDRSRLPGLRALEPNLCYLGWHGTLRGAVTLAEIKEVFAWVEGDADLEVTEVVADGAVTPAARQPTTNEEPVAPKTEAAPAATPGAANAPAATAARGDAEAGLGSIRVAVDKIDLLMNMVGELVITQSMLGELEGDGPLDAHRVERLREGLGLLARNTRSLQESVMRLRSMPIGIVFNRFPRLVHDLGRQLGKEVELKIAGQNTELDKTVLEKLGDPLVHLVRNSLDHGIEAPELRRAAGKPELGTLELRAYHRGGDIVVEVVDDGKGIDRTRVIARAREMGILGPDEEPGEDALRDILFAPGFSTAKEVTNVSGRGVGMDVVRRNVKSLGGDVFVDTTPGRGTRISLRLPLTLAIIDGQLIRVGVHAYVVPLLSIVESVQVEPRRVTRFQGQRDIYRLRDELIPMMDLCEVLGVSGQRVSVDEALMVVVEADGEHVGLLVHELLAQQQVVVKSLESNYGRVEGLAGATILGDGSVSFILDVAGIGRLMRRSHAREGVRAA